MDGAVAKRFRERLVDEAVLFEQRQARKTRRRHRHLEVVAAAGAILDAELGRIRKRALKQMLERLDCHAAMLASARRAALVREVLEQV